MFCYFRGSSFRERCSGPLQLNTWIPGPAPSRDAAHEQRLRDFLGQFGPEVPQWAADAKVVDFEAQVWALGVLAMHIFYVYLCFPLPISCCSLLLFLVFLVVVDACCC